MDLCLTWNAPPRRLQHEPFWDNVPILAFGSQTVGLQLKREINWFQGPGENHGPTWIRMLGQPSTALLTRILTVKPTGLPVLRMPFFLPDLYLHADEHAQKPSVQAIGVNADASFRIAYHKAQTTDTLKNKGCPVKFPRKAIIPACPQVYSGHTRHCSSHLPSEEQHTFASHGRSGALKGQTTSRI